jgi:membrane dipeptidase
MWIFDAHLDLAMNAIEWNRDLTLPLDEIRRSESKMRDKVDRARGTVSLPEMRGGRVLACVATLIARVEHNAFSPVQGWRSPAQAWAMTRAQRAWYECMERAGEMSLISDANSLRDHLNQISEVGDQQAATAEVPVGFVLSLEGADAIIDLDYLHRMHADGLRVVGPAHYGPGRYANGTDASGPLPAIGRDLLREMDRLGMILDVTHLCDECFWEAMDIFTGPVWASHQNCRALVEHNRQFDDAQIRTLIQRGAVIGTALDAWMLAPGWVRGESTPQSLGVTLQNAADHIDHICQIAGSAAHCGMGTDLDGAYGFEQTPSDVNRISDIAGLFKILADRGYSAEALERIAAKNFVGFLQGALPS